MRETFDVKILSENPYVYAVDSYRLTLSYGLMVELYKKWKEEKDSPGLALGMTEILEKKGIIRKLTGNTYVTDLMVHFKNSGFPVIGTREKTFTPGYEENPLILSGKFEYTGHKGIRPTEGFMEELSANYPAMTVEESMSAMGIDTDDVGCQRLIRIRNDVIEKKRETRYKEESPGYNEAAIRDNLKETGPSEWMEKDVSDNCENEKNPYVKYADRDGVQLHDAFYNEAYLLGDLGIERILSVFEIPEDLVTERSKAMIRTKLRYWERNDRIISGKEGAGLMILRIERNRIRSLTEAADILFNRIGKLFREVNTENRRRVCRFLRDLPEDPGGVYDRQHILFLSGIKRSTFYALLNDESYGMGAERRRQRDEEDTALVREAAGYKGYEKGIRQICMLIPHLFGKRMSLYRVRKLARTAGIRTSVRKPSRNRKAMKALIERNGKADLLLRRFRLHRPGEVRLTDVTYLDYGDGQRAYGSASIDPVTGVLICFIVSEHNDLSLALDTLAAMDRHPAVNGAILHSDQGMLYMTDDFQTAVIEKALSQSMSRRGNCWDNAPQESFFGHFKDECPYGDSRTIEELRTKIDDYAVYYNTERGMWNRERMTPSEYEAHLLSLNDEEWSEYLRNEEERYRKMKEAAERAAVRATAKRRSDTKEGTDEACRR